MAFVAAVYMWGVSASAAPAPCTTCRGPVWSWDTFPAFLHGAEQNGPDGGFTAADLELIAKFPIVTMEKWQGDNVKPFIWEEDAWVHGARQIKKASPNTTVVVWLDSFRIYTSDKSLNPDLKPQCTTGHYRAAEFLETGGRMNGRLDPTSVYLLKNSTGLPALESWSGCHMFDHTQVVARQYWAQMCLNLTASGVIDGCGADASWQTGVEQQQAWGLDPKTAEAWEFGHNEMMRETTALLGDGVLLGKQAYEVGDYVNGALCESCPASNATVLTLRNLTARAKASGKRLLYECHGKGNLDEVAAFLCGAGPYHYYGMGGWTSENGHWLDGVMGRKLGEPLADAAYDAATQTWTRSFAGGTRVVFNAGTHKGSITWGDE